MQVIDLKNDIIYLTDDQWEDLSKLLKLCALIIGDTEKALSNPHKIARACTRLAGWNVFIGALAGKAEADYRTEYAKEYRKYKETSSKNTVSDCENAAEEAIKTYRRQREILRNLRDDIKEFHQTLRAILKSKEN